MPDIHKMNPVILNQRMKFFRNPGKIDHSVKVDGSLICGLPDRSRSRSGCPDPAGLLFGQPVCPGRWVHWSGQRSAHRRKRTFCHWCPHLELCSSSYLLCVGVRTCEVQYCQLFFHESRLLLLLNWLKIVKGYKSNEVPKCEKTDRSPDRNLENMLL